MELARTCIGTPYYLSPEICENRPYNNKRFVDYFCMKDLPNHDTCKFHDYGQHSKIVMFDSQGLIDYLILGELKQGSKLKKNLVVNL